MIDTSLDLSKKTELRWLSGLVRLVGSAAGGLPFFIAGATARDLILEYGYGIVADRKTHDVDFAFRVADWPAFETLRSRLLATERFTAAVGNAHRLQFDADIAIDLVPFGAIEKPDRTIAWPPNGAVVMSVFGFREAMSATISVSLPQGVAVPVVSLAALAILKIAAWLERRYVQPGKDAQDLWLVMRYYLDAGNRDRLYAEAAQLLERDDFDYETAGAWLLGHDMGKLLAASEKSKIAAFLEHESDPEGLLALVGDMRARPEKALPLLRAMTNGVKEY
jgi:predicted nucleotidyltransferase